MTNVVVTGASGFLGGHVVAYLLRAGREVVGFDRDLPAADHPAQAIRTVVGDIRDADLLARLVRTERTDTIIHLAAVPGGAEREMYDVDVQGAQALLQAVLREDRGARIVFAGSSAIYGDAQDLAAIDEDAPLAPVTAYGRSKEAVDRIGRDAFERRGLAVMRARPFNIVGPGQRPEFFCSSVARQIAVAESGRGAPLIHVRGTRTARDFVDVRDVARGLAMIADRGAPGAAYNVCSGTATPLSAVTAQLCAAATVEVRVIADIPQPDGLRDVQTQRGTYAKLRAACGWAPEIPLATSLIDTLNYWRDLNR